MVNSGSYESPGAEGESLRAEFTQLEDETAVARQFASACGSLAAVVGEVDEVGGGGGGGGRVPCSVPLDRVRDVLELCRQQCVRAAAERRRQLCLFCERTFTSNSLRQKHVERCHAAGQTRRCSSRTGPHTTSATACCFCSHLNHTDHTLAQLLDHLVREHSNRYFACVPCQERFAAAGALRDHNRALHPDVAEPASPEPAAVSSPCADPAPASSAPSPPPQQPPQPLEDAAPASSRPPSPPPAHPDTQEDAALPKKKPAPKASKTAATKRGPAASKRITVKSTKNGVRSNLRTTRASVKQMNAFSKNRKTKLGKPEADLEENSSTTSTSPLTTPSSPPSPAPPPAPAAVRKAMVSSSSSVFSLVNAYTYKYEKIYDHSSDSIKEVNAVQFNAIFDREFYTRTVSNIRENLLNHLDGKLNRNVESETRISNFEHNPNVASDCDTKNCSGLLDNYGCSLSLHAVTPVATLLGSSQYGEDFDSQIEYGAKASEKKPKKVAVVKYKFPNKKYNSLFYEKDPHSDLTSLDMWTQLTVKRRQQRCHFDEDEPEGEDGHQLAPRSTAKQQVDELNHILDKRGPFEDLRLEANTAQFLELRKKSNLSEDSLKAVDSILEELISRVVLQTESNAKEEGVSIVEVKPELCEEMYKNLDIPDYLQLARSPAMAQPIDQTDSITLICSAQDESLEDAEQPIMELSGEWARPRIYICATCGLKLPNLKALEDHKNVSHPNIWCSHYEFVGKQSEIYRHLNIPGLGKVGIVETLPLTRLWQKSDARVCSKCGKQCQHLGELHKHMLECGGDWTWMLARKKCKYRPYGARSRRRRHQGYKRTCNPEIPREHKPKIKTAFIGPRPKPSKPSDAETIERMLANLPPKRHRKVISMRDGIQRPRKPYKQKLVSQNSPTKPPDSSPSSTTSTTTNITTKKLKFKPAPSQLNAKQNLRSTIKRKMSAQKLRNQKTSAASQPEPTDDTLKLRSRASKPSTDAKLEPDITQQLVGSKHKIRNKRMISRILGSKIFDSNSALVTRRRLVKAITQNNLIRKTRLRTKAVDPNPETADAKKSDSVGDNQTSSKTKLPDNKKTKSILKNQSNSDENDATVPETPSDKDSEITAAQKVAKKPNAKRLSQVLAKITKKPSQTEAGHKKVDTINAVIDEVVKMAYKDDKAVIESKEQVATTSSENNKSKEQSLKKSKKLTPVKKAQKLEESPANSDSLSKTVSDDPHEIEDTTPLAELISNDLKLESRTILKTAKKSIKKKTSKFVQNLKSMHKSAKQSSTVNNKKEGIATKLIRTLSIRGSKRRKKKKNNNQTKSKKAEEKEISETRVENGITEEKDCDNNAETVTEVEKANTSVVSNEFLQGIGLESVQSPEPLVAPQQNPDSVSAPPVENNPVVALESGQTAPEVTIKTEPCTDLNPSDKQVNTNNGTSVNSALNKFKSKIKRSGRGLNDCIAMLKCKLEQKYQTNDAPALDKSKLLILNSPAVYNNSDLSQKPIVQIEQTASNNNIDSNINEKPPVAENAHTKITPTETNCTETEITESKLSDSKITESILTETRLSGSNVSEIPVQTEPVTKPRNVLEIPSITAQAQSKVLTSEMSTVETQTFSDLIVEDAVPFVRPEIPPNSQINFVLNAAMKNCLMECVKSKCEKLKIENQLSVTSFKSAFKDRKIGSIRKRKRRINAAKSEKKSAPKHIPNVPVVAFENSARKGLSTATAAHPSGDVSDDDIPLSKLVGSSPSHVKLKIKLPVDKKKRRGKKKTELELLLAQNERIPPVSFQHKIEERIALDNSVNSQIEEIEAELAVEKNNKRRKKKQKRSKQTKMNISNGNLEINTTITEKKLNGESGEEVLSDISKYVNIIKQCEKLNFNTIVSNSIRLPSKKQTPAVGTVSNVIRGEDNSENNTIVGTTEIDLDSIVNNSISEELSTEENGEPIVPSEILKDTWSVVNNEIRNEAAVDDDQVLESTNISLEENLTDEECNKVGDINLVQNSNLEVSDNRELIMSTEETNPSTDLQLEESSNDELLLLNDKLEVNLVTSAKIPQQSDELNNEKENKFLETSNEYTNDENMGCYTSLIENNIEKYSRINNNNETPMNIPINNKIVTFINNKIDATINNKTDSAFINHSDTKQSNVEQQTNVVELNENPVATFDDVLQNDYFNSSSDIEEDRFEDDRDNDALVDISGKTSEEDQTSFEIGKNQYGLDKNEFQINKNIHDYDKNLCEADANECATSQNSSCEIEENEDINRKENIFDMLNSLSQQIMSLEDEPCENFMLNKTLTEANTEISTAFKQNHIYPLSENPENAKLGYVDNGKENAQEKSLYKKVKKHKKSSKKMKSKKLGRTKLKIILTKPDNYDQLSKLTAKIDGYDDTLEVMKNNHLETQVNYTVKIHLEPEPEDIVLEDKNIYLESKSFLPSKIVDKYHDIIKDNNDFLQNTSSDSEDEVPLAVLINKKKKDDTEDLTSEVTVTELEKENENSSDLASLKISEEVYSTSEQEILNISQEIMSININRNVSEEITSKVRIEEIDDLGSEFLQEKENEIEETINLNIRKLVTPTNEIEKFENEEQQTSNEENEPQDREDGEGDKEKKEEEEEETEPQESGTNNKETSTEIQPKIEIVEPQPCSSLQSPVIAKEPGEEVFDLLKTPTSQNTDAESAFITTPDLKDGSLIIKIKKNKNLKVRIRKTKKQRRRVIPKSLNKNYVRKRRKVHVTAFCDICQKTFKRKENLVSHERTLTHITKLSELEAMEKMTVAQIEAMKKGLQWRDHIAKEEVDVSEKQLEQLHEEVEIKTKIEMIEEGEIPNCPEADDEEEEEDEEEIEEKYSFHEVMEESVESMLPDHTEESILPDDPDENLLQRESGEESPSEQGEEARRHDQSGDENIDTSGEEILPDTPVRHSLAGIDQPKPLPNLLPGLINSNTSNLKLVDIINEVLDKPVSDLNMPDSNFIPRDAIKNPETIEEKYPEPKRYKSLGERKSFDSDNFTMPPKCPDIMPLNDNYNPIPSVHNGLLSKQLSLLENIIEETSPNLNYIEDSMSLSSSQFDEQLSEQNMPEKDVFPPSDYSAKLSNPQIKFSHNSDVISRYIKPNNFGHFDNIGNTFAKQMNSHYEEVSQPQFDDEDPKKKDNSTRKILNRDEELFLECCSLLKSGSEITGSGKKSSKHINNLNDNPSWIKEKQAASDRFVQREPFSWLAQGSRVNTPIGEPFVNNDWSNSNSAISSEWLAHKAPSPDRPIASNTLSKKENNVNSQVRYGDIQFEDISIDSIETSKTLMAGDIDSKNMQLDFHNVDFSGEKLRVNEESSRDDRLEIEEDTKQETENGKLETDDAKEERLADEENKIDDQDHEDSKLDVDDTKFDEFEPKIDTDESKVEEDEDETKFSDELSKLEVISKSDEESKDKLVEDESKMDLDELKDEKVDEAIELNEETSNLDELKIEEKEEAQKEFTTNGVEEELPVDEFGAELKKKVVTAFGGLMAKALSNRLHAVVRKSKKSRTKNDLVNSLQLSIADYTVRIRKPKPESAPDSDTSDCPKKLITKGAMKIFEGLKVSIPTQDLNLPEVLNLKPKTNTLPEISEPTPLPVPQKPSEKVISPPVKNGKIKKLFARVGNKLGLRETKKKQNKHRSSSKNNKNHNHKDKPHDIYDFEESLDNNFTFNNVSFPHFRKEHSEKTEDVFGKFKENHERSAEDNNKLQEEDRTSLNKWNIESDSDTDRYYDSMSFEEVSFSSESRDESNSVAKGKPAQKKNVEKKENQKKCMIMGRIFKNASKPKLEDKIPEIRDFSSEENSKLEESFIDSYSSTENIDNNVEFERESPVANNITIVNNTNKLSEKEMNLLFDKLLEEEQKNSVFEKPKTPTFEDTPEGNQFEVVQEEINSEGNSSKKAEKPKIKPVVKTKKRQRHNSENSTSSDEFTLHGKHTNSSKKRHKAQRKSAKSKKEGGINLEQEIKECIGVAGRKSQRKCTSGKQNVLVEFWSSDETTFEEETPVVVQTDEAVAPPPPPSPGPVVPEIIVPEVEKPAEVESIVNENEMNVVLEAVSKPECTEEIHTRNLDVYEFDSDVELNGAQPAGMQRPKVARRNPKSRQSRSRKHSRTHDSEDTEYEGERSRRKSEHRRRRNAEDPHSNADCLAVTRKKRHAGEMLYYWSSSSDDEFQDLIEVKPARDDTDDDRPMQHGWIVGDSPKKLVTMLAQAKGKKIDGGESVKELGKKARTTL